MSMDISSAEKMAEIIISTIKENEGIDFSISQKTIIAIAGILLMLRNETLKVAAKYVDAVGNGVEFNIGEAATKPYRILANGIRSMIEE